MCFPKKHCLFSVHKDVHLECTQAIFRIMMAEVPHMKYKVEHIDIIQFHVAGKRGSVVNLQFCVVSYTDILNHP